MLVVIARTRFKTTADRDIMAAALAVSTASSVQEPGMVCYQSSIDPVDPLVLNAVEIYRGEQDMFDHVHSGHMATLMDAIADVEAEVTLRGLAGDLEPVDMDALLARGGLGGNGKITFSGAL